MKNKTSKVIRKQSKVIKKRKGKKMKKYTKKIVGGNNNQSSSVNFSEEDDIYGKDELAIIQQTNSDPNTSEENPPNTSEKKPPYNYNKPDFKNALYEKEQLKKYTNSDTARKYTDLNNNQIGEELKKYGPQNPFRRVFAGIAQGIPPEKREQFGNNLKTGGKSILAIGLVGAIVGGILATR